MNRLKQAAPWLVATVALIGSAAGWMGSAQVRGFDLERFMRLPVLEGGRVKPLDSIARNSLLVIRSQQEFRDHGKTVTADEWLLDVLFRPLVANQEPAFVINDPDVLGLIGLKQTSDRYFSFATLQPHLEEIEKQADLAHPIDAKERTRFQSAIANLYDRLYLYYRLQHSLHAPEFGDIAEEVAAREEPASAARQAALIQLAIFRPLPGAGAGDWRSVGEALRDARGAVIIDRELLPLALAEVAWNDQDPSAFNAATTELLAKARPADLAEATREQLFNLAQPFYAGMVLYVLALLILFASWATQPKLLQRCAYAVLLVGLGVHTAGLVARVILQGRPPVTNLYSSAIFVGWAAVVLGAVMERIYKRGFGTAVAAAAGFASLIIAHHLASDGDTMEMMRAVLDSNFWLGTHVVTITIGYSGTFLAGVIALAWTLRRHATSSPDPATDKAMVGMCYGTVCFAMLFSFVGTVLGGIWADQSWGRFWGWDPKENGALLIVLWNAIILHARWGGFVRVKGLMAMAIFGNIITSLSWFGVNMLGVGLHSYGFMDKAFWALIVFAATQLLFIALALLPPQFWRGHVPPSAGQPQAASR